MNLLVADVGGTNTRIALFHKGGAMAHVGRYQNADHASFYEVLEKYAANRDLSQVTTCCVAVAGPVTSDCARLTNRGWKVDANGIAAVIPSLSAGSVLLANDLVALGYALPDLAPAQMSLIRASRDPGLANHQQLVVGMGTGFNICVVKSDRGPPVVIEAELGHASLPSTVGAALSDALGSKAARLKTYEDALSGRALPWLYRQFSDGKVLTGSEILTAYDPARRDAATRSVDLAAHILGMVVRELVFVYLPFGGIHFAGGVARGLLGSPAGDVFLTAFQSRGPMDEQVALVPLHLITDDAAGLLGAANFARSKARNPLT